MKTKLAVALFVAALAGFAALGCQRLLWLRPKLPNRAVPIPSATNILARLNQAHPRLLATAEDFAELKQADRLRLTTSVLAYEASGPGPGHPERRRLRATRFPMACGCWPPAAGS